MRRIDIVYVCANTDLAQQNIRRLNVTEDETITFQPLLVVDEPDGEEQATDPLRLVFTCCHPALASEAQVALTLREAE